MTELWTIVEKSWRPALEITMLSGGIYYVLMFVRRTRAWSVVVGYIVLFALLTLTTLLDLIVVHEILSKFFAFSAIAILVLFQPEIRRMLGKLGTMHGFYSVREQRENIEVIIQTADRLSDVRIGALIAIEQTIDLSELVESGIAVDCEATAEMLETIFFPNNAIHDGGVILKGDRIAQAACIFPLTRRQDLNKSLGTRHRAALGLSEESDAVVVVVSEETGMIAYTYQGRLVRGITSEELRAFLSSIFVKVPPEARKPARRWWLRRLGGAKEAT